MSAAIADQPQGEKRKTAHRCAVSQSENEGYIELHLMNLPVFLSRQWLVVVFGGHFMNLPCASRHGFASTAAPSDAMNANAATDERMRFI